jgi:hypothetical protein
MCERDREFNPQQWHYAFYTQSSRSRDLLLETTHVNIIGMEQLAYIVYIGLEIKRSASGFMFYQTLAYYVIAYMCSTTQVSLYSRYREY